MKHETYPFPLLPRNIKLIIRIEVSSAASTQVPIVRKLRFNVLQGAVRLHIVRQVVGTGVLFAGWLC